MTSHEFLTPPQLRDRYEGVFTLKTFTNWRCPSHDGAGPPFVKVGARIFYPLEKLIEWESNNYRPEKSAVGPEASKQAVQ